MAASALSQPSKVRDEGAELARRTGIKQPNIVRIERGEHEPGIATVGRILAAIGAGWCDLTLSDAEYEEYVAESGKKSSLPRIERFAGPIIHLSALIYDLTEERRPGYSSCLLVWSPSGV